MATLTRDAIVPVTLALNDAMPQVRLFLAQPEDVQSAIVLAVIQSVLAPAVANINRDATWARLTLGDPLVP